MPIHSSSDVQKLLDSFITQIESHKSDPAFDRARLEAIWLRDELKGGRVKLPFDSTNELYLCYAVSEGLLEAVPEVQDLAEQVVDAVLD